MSLGAEFKAHFPAEVSQEICDYARDVVFYDSRYVFVKKNRLMQQAFCSHCRKDYHIRGDHLKHNQEWVCQKCQSPVVVKSHGLGRKKLFTDAYFVWYEKSQVDPNAIVAMGFHAHRDYQDYRTTETKFRLVSMYLFEPGHSEMRYLDCWCNKWIKPRNIRSEFTNSMQYKHCFVSHDSIAIAVKGTSFEYCTWERYKDIFTREDMVHFFALAARYPCIEYLTKMGFRECVKAKLIGDRTFGAINWNGATVEKVLRMSKHEIKTMMSAQVMRTPEFLHCYHLHKQHGLTLSFEDCSRLSEGLYLDKVKMLRGAASIPTLSKYILKQMNRHFLGAYVTLRDLEDYWDEAEELGLDLTKEHIRFPNNLQEAHQDTTKRIKVKVDMELNASIQKRLPKLDRLSFTWSGLHLRPAKSSIELFDEGKALNHCVGRYAERYAKGETDLYVIRKDTEPDKPFYTVEIQNGLVVQCRGKNNRDKTKEVAAFIEAFKREKLRVKSAQPA